MYSTEQEPGEWPGTWVSCRISGMDPWCACCGANGMKLPFAGLLLNASESEFQLDSLEEEPGVWPGTEA